MTELDQIFAAWDNASARDESGVLATVVRVQGSTYRRSGARLLMTSGGRRIGSVSGGCLEADLVKKAWWLTEGGRAAIRKYDTSIEGDIAQEFGLGCNGVIEVLLERLNGASVSPLSMVPLVKTLRRPGFLATVIESNDNSIAQIGQRSAFLPDHSVSTDINDEGLAAFAQAAARNAYPKPEVLTYEEGAFQAALFMEPVLPTLRLLVFGAGDDAEPVVRLAKFMGYEAMVLDGRSHLARVERFPAAESVRVTTGDNVLAGIELDDWTAAVVMSHSYAQDLATVRALGRRHPLPYLGMLGPRKRTERLLSEAGIALDDVVNALHSPIGLDIGADGAEQIALAIIAEIQAVLNRRAGGRLREKAGPLQVPGEESREGLYQVPLACPMA